MGGSLVPCPSQAKMGLFAWLLGRAADRAESKNRRVIARGFSQCFHVLGDQLVLFVGEIVADMLGLDRRM